jgi:dTMP kinase
MSSQSPIRGRFIAFEGGEACGKSTQSRLLADSLDAVLTREPGGTIIGAQLRSLALSPDTIGLDARAEALVMAADRAQHVAELVAPVLASGRHVVTDRFAGSSIAYQGFGRGLPVDEILGISRWATAGVWPDLILLLDVPAVEADRRLGSDRDRMESESVEFHAAVIAGFHAQAADEPERWAVIDGSGTIDEVADAVRKIVAQRLQLSL